MKSVSVLAILTTAAALAVPSLPLPAGVPVSRPDILRDDEEPEAPAARDENKTTKTDPDDIRHALEDLSLVRDLKKLSKPTRKGLWQEYVNQPYYTPEVKADKLLFFGQYEDAEKLFLELLKGEKLDARDKAHYQEGLLAATLLQGHDRHVKRFGEVLATVPEAVKTSPRVLALRAQALKMEGKTDDARALLAKYVQENPKVKVPKAGEGDVLALYNGYAEILEQQADYAGAIGVYGKLIELEKEDLPQDAEIQTNVVQAIYRHAVLSGNAKEKNQYVIGRLSQICNGDSTYWPAFLLSAKILLAAHNEKQGGARLNDVLSRNPNNIEAMFLSVDHAIDTYNFEGAERALDEIKDRTQSAEAKAAEGRLLLKKRTPEKAEAPLAEAIRRNASLPTARGWLAAMYYILNKPEKAQAELSAVNVEGKPHPIALFECGEVLRDARQFRQAEKLYLEAASRASWWSEPQAALAQLYLETGQEDLAKKAYAESFRIDPSNMRAVNQLRLLEEFMNGFEKIESKGFLPGEGKLPRFIVKFSPEDRVLAELAAEWMEKIYPEVTGYFQHEPDTPTIIEFFPNHDQFGVRTTGLPWIGTVGACTGNVIAMDVPRGSAKNMMGAFDWARVLRHEYTHTITLSMTNNRVPHWLTEAAACEQELAPRDWDNCQLLASNYRAGTLFTLDTLTWGFIKPKRSTDRRLAYMQSQWVYQYLVEAYGHQKMLEFFRAFRDAKTEPQAYQAVYGKDTGALNKEFMAWAGKQIEAWGLPSDPLPKKEELDKILAEKPDDVEAHYKYAWVLLSSGQPRALQQAKDHLEKAQKAAPDDVKVRELLGAVINNLGDKAKAKEILTKVATEDPKRPVALRTLGLIAMGEKDFTGAEKWFTALQAVRPAEDTSYLKLAGVYLLKKENKKAAQQLATLQLHEQKNEMVPRQLALLYREQGQLSEAESSAFRAVRINPYNAVNHDLLAQILLQQQAAEGSASQDVRRGLARRAAQHWRYATELQPKYAAFWASLAEAQDAAGDAAAATAAAKKAVELQPASPARKWIKE